MKYTRIIYIYKTALVTVIAATVLSAMLPFVHWYYKDSALLNVWIIDKTVPVATYREHKGLMWILNHFKVLDKTTNAAFQFD